MDPTEVNIRPAGPHELEAINRVVEAAVGRWDLPDRVKRLSLPSYLYNEVDFHTLAFLVAEARHDEIIGVAAWEPAGSREVPDAAKGLLLHGLYVMPRWQGKGVGSALFDAVEQVARDRGDEGILVKAQPGADGFFRARAMERLSGGQDRQQYAHRYWKAVG